MKKKLLIVLLMVITIWGCKKEEEEVKPTEKPWETDMTMGHFSINSKSIVTNEDGKSINYIADMVQSSKLPTSAFEVFTIHAYVPTAKGYSTRLKSTGVEVSYTGGTTGDIYMESDFEGQETIDDQEYDVYSITGEYSEQFAITKTNFENVVFSFTAVYEDNDGEVVKSRGVSLEVFKENTDGTDGGGTDGGGTDGGGTDGGGTDGGGTDGGGTDGGGTDGGGTDGGGTDGGGTDGGGGTSYGNFIFWTKTDLNCGTITVTITGESYGYISKYYTNGPPSCGADGCANFTLPVGTYSFSAECSDYIWNGSISVTANGCSSMQLY